MSIEPAIYRAVIDDVMSAIRPEFDEYGVAEEVLGELQHVSTNLTNHDFILVPLFPQPDGRRVEMGD